MSLLTELNAILPPLLPVETGVFSDTPPDRYAVITPLAIVLDWMYRRHGSLFLTKAATQK